ncbi:hypothetical protein [Gordonia sp. NPDC003950]
MDAGEIDARTIRRAAPATSSARPGRLAGSNPSWPRTSAAGLMSATSSASVLNSALGSTGTFGLFVLVNIASLA